MSMLAPLFLLGALLIAAPVVAHLIRRAVRDRIVFSSTRWFEPSAPHLSRRNRIEHPWLLLLRCLVVLVLAAGFSRPFLRRDIPMLPASAAPQHVVLVLDDSASMQRRGLWEQAASRAHGVAASLGPIDQLTVISAGSRVEPIISAARWNETSPGERTTLVTNTITARSPGWGSTLLDAAMTDALDELAAMNESAATPSPGRIVVVSDFADGARLSGLAGMEWPPGTVVELVPVNADRTQSNASIHWMGWNLSAEGVRLARVRVTHDGDRSLTLRLLVREVRSGRPVGEPRVIALGPRETRTVAVDLPPDFNEPVRLEIAGDAESFDNVAWAIPPRARKLELPYLGRHTADDPARPFFYLTRATEGWREPAAQLRAFDPDTVHAWPEAPLLIIGEALPSGAQARLRNRLEAGGFALLLARDPSLVETLSALTGVGGWKAVAGARSGALLADIDFRHPLFAPFADPRFSDFTRVRFWQAVSVQPPTSEAATVVARFDDGGAAVLEIPVGRGRLILWGGDWTPAASQWVLSTKFVPWIQALFERAAGGPASAQSAEVGNTVRIAAAGDAPWRPLRADRRDVVPSSTGPASPGIYEVGDGGESRLVAIQVPAAESRLDSLPLDTWEQLGVPLAALQPAVPTAVPSRAAPVATTPGALEREQQLWRWLLIAAALLLALESAAAFATSRQTTTAATP